MKSFEQHWPFGTSDIIISNLFAILIPYLSSDLCSCQLLISLTPLRERWMPFHSLLYQVPFRTSGWNVGLLLRCCSGQRASSCDDEGSTWFLTDNCRHLTPRIEFKWKLRLPSQRAALGVGPPSACHSSQTPVSPTVCT